MMRRLQLLTLVLVYLLCEHLHAQTFNYGDALQKSIYFYECQRSGTMPANNRVNWKGNSGLNDGSDVSKNLTGGWYDAGDNVKFNFPMAYSATMLAWGVLENKAGYIKTGQYDKLKEALRWANDYFIKCHTAPNELYGQVGNGGLDHAFWGAAEIMQMARPAYKIDASKPGTDLAAETAAAMAAASLVFANDDPAYSALLLTHAKQLYTFADTYRGKYSDAITDVVPYYNSWSGYQDELVWGATWLYKATNDASFLSKAETEYSKLSNETGATVKSYKWTTAWDDKSTACYILLAKLTGKDIYKTDAERFLDYWTVGYNGSKITYTPGGLAWLDTWGSLRYSANTSFLALAYSGTASTPAKGQTYYNFGLRQINYMLGDNPGKRSFMVGFGVNPPKNPHHRTAHGTWVNNLTGEPVNNRHIIYGALVGGPGNDDSYVDDRSNYTTNEIACDYNAAFTGALARLTDDFGGVPSVIPVETPTDEYYCDAKINTSGPNFFEPAVFLNNHTAWPARMPANLSFRYFFDISEGVAAGKTIADYSVVSNYNQGGTLSSFKQWAGNIYYVEVSYANQLIYPGGQSESKRETQFRIYGPAGAWDVTNDPSAQGLTSVLTRSNVICVYENGVLVNGTEPKGGVVIPVTGILVSPSTLSTNVGTSSQLTVTVNPTDATNKAVNFSSSNPAVATVSATGLVTSVSVGTATITATSVSGSKTASCLVTVSNIGVVSVSLTPSTVTINKGETSQLTASILPTNASNKALTYTSSNPAVATVSATGLVNGIGQGTAAITVTTADGNKTATSGVTVTDIVVAVSGVSLSPTSLGLNVGQTSQLTASVLPANANNKSVTYTSSNPAVLNVSASGLVTALANGTASVTVKTTDGNFTAVCTVSITTPTTTKNFLTTANGKLYDATGKQVRLTGVNWFGFETAQLAPHGLWSRDCKSMLMQMKDVGFNCVRLPWTNAMLRPGKTIQINSYGSDPYTQRSPMNAVESTFTTPIQLLDQIIKYAQELDLKIVLDSHARQPDNYLGETIWYDNTCTEQQWIDDWTFLVKRYKDYDSFIACDLDNEPHGNATWGTSSPATDWNKAAERCGNAILAENPNMLIFVEGVEFYKGVGYWWGGNLLGAKTDPIVLSKQSQLVYSPHEYGPTVFAQTWFNDPTFPANMPAIWDNNFGYLQNSGTSHLFVGEFGIKTFGGKDEVWIREFLKYMGNSYSWTFWCWNPNSGDTGGILDDQWTNLVTAKVDLLKPYMAPIIPNGKVGQLVAVTSVGLDQTSLALTSIGKTAQLTATVLPSNASDKSVSYTSSNPAVASVSASGLITSIATGSTVITVKTTDGGKTATCNVTVSVGTISVTSVSLTPASVSINKGASAQLTAAVLPIDATNKTVSYTSSNANVATVSSTGLVSGVGQGTASITVTTLDGNYTATSVVSVTIPSCTLSSRFAVPRTSGLPNIDNVAFNYVYVLGNGGPNLSNVTNCTVNWSLSNNGLWQFSFLTNNNAPSWYVDFLPKITQTLASSSPSIKFTNSGITGFDGEYWVNMDGANLVLVAKSDAYALYFSKTAGQPSVCNKSLTISKTENSTDFSLYPNPAKDAVAVTFDDNGINELTIRDMSGRLIFQKNFEGETETIIPLDHYTSGVYIVCLQNGNGTKIKKLVIE